jgi:hypothetical protein
MLTLSWTSVEGALSYEVWLGPVNNSASASKYGADISSPLSATISGLTNGTTYYVWVKAKNGAGVSGFSPVASGIPSGGIPPAAPGAPTVNASDGTLNLSWPPVEGALS